MKVLFLIEDFKIGGVEKSLVDLLGSLNLDFAQYSVLTWGDDFSLLEERTLNEKIKIRKLFNIKKLIATDSIYINKFLNYVNVLILHLYLLFKNYDVIINYHYCQNWRYSYLKPKCRRYIAAYHEGIIYDECFSKRITKHLFKLFFISERVKEKVDDRFDYLNNRTELLGNVINYNEILEKSNAYDVELSDNLNILTVARFSFDKGIDIAIESAGILKRMNLDFNWYFIGSGTERLNLEKMVKEKGLDDNVIFLGYKNNPYPYINKCDLYVQPSRSESFGITIAEALIFDKSIISTSTYGPVQYFSDFSNIEFCDISPEALANSIMEKSKNRCSFDSSDFVKNYISKHNKMILSVIYESLSDM